MIFGLFRRPQDDEHIRTTYAAIVAQARHRAFYTDFGIPDTLEGRYEMLMLHAFLYMRRLKDEPESVRAMGQEVFDLMFLDMDRTLREMGVGDLSVPKKIKKMASAFYGRISAYDAALTASGNELEETLARNIFESQAQPQSRALAAYIHAASAELSAQTAQTLKTIPPKFINPEVYAPREGCSE